ncbi:DUF2125 domain-containing protein, partial [uncultured Brevundimonas sp.]|uniref:DUF2125 domain-containing protein n=1 Tax=uncultured Brevundimonas sp. TaxID=213418 RepID=UPI00261F2EF4
MTSAPEPQTHSRRALFIPFIIVGVLLAVWTVWWFWLANEAKGQFETRLDQLKASGWTVEYSGISTSGWPMHTRLTVKDGTFIAPSGHGIKSPAIAAEANSYNPLHWVVVAENGLTLVRADKGETTVTAEAIRLSLTGLRQRWPNVAFEMATPVFIPAQGAAPFPLADAALIQLYMRPHLTSDPTPGDDVDVMFRLVKAKGRDGGPVQGFAQNGELTLQVEAVVEKASALRQPATSAGLLAAWTRAGGRFVNVKGEMTAGESHALLTSPVLYADDKGQLEGEVQFKARKPLAALVGLAGSHQGTPADRAAAARAATASPQGGEGEAGQDIELSVLFRKGRTYLGPFALAPAPKLF